MAIIYWSGDHEVGCLEDPILITLEIEQLVNSVRVRTLSSPIRHLSSRRLDWPVSTESMLGVTNLLDPWRDRCLHILVAGAAASVAVLLLVLHLECGL